jgi:hypothetical protein
LLPLLAVAFAALLLTTSDTHAVAANDDYPGQTITSPPFSTATDSTGATVVPGDPQSFCHGALRHTLWWNYTSQSDATIVIRFETTDWSPLFVVYTEDGSAGAPLAEVACGGFLPFPGEPHVTEATTALAVEAGHTYYIQLGGLGLLARDPDSGLVALTVYHPAPPANDNFANSVAIGGLPFEHEVDLSGATSEPFEPQSPCVSDPEFGFEFANTAWYSYTPTEDATILVEAYSQTAYAAAVAWTGEPGSFVEAGWLSVHHGRAGGYDVPLPGRRPGVYGLPGDPARHGDVRDRIVRQASLPGR